jgi:hypothetical protein
VRTVLLSVRLQRFELITFGLLTAAWLLAVVACVVVISSIEQSAPGCFDTNSQAPECLEAFAQGAIWNQSAELLLWAVLAAPVAYGAVLGVPIVAREIEHQTAQMSWSLAESRVRWLTMRVIPVALIVLALLTIISVAAEVLAGQLADSELGFTRHDQRGLLVPVRGLLVLAIALFVATLFGRVLPALLVTILLSVIVLVGVVLGTELMARQDAVVVKLSDPTAEEVLTGARVLESVAFLPDGSVTSDFRVDRIPPGTTFDGARVIPRSAYWGWIAREAGLTLVLAVAFTGAATWHLKQRRPM